jgi:hypothetical protein
VGSLPVQNLRLNRGDDQITYDFIGHLKSFSVSDPSIDPVINKSASIAVSDIDVAINAFRSYFPKIPLDLNQKPPTFPPTHFLSHVKPLWQVLQVRAAFSWFCDLHLAKFVLHALSLFEESFDDKHGSKLSLVVSELLPQWLDEMAGPDLKPLTVWQWAVAVHIASRCQSEEALTWLLRALGRHSGLAAALTLQLFCYISVTTRVSVMQLDKVHEAAIFQSVIADELSFKPQLTAHEEAASLLLANLCSWAVSRDKQNDLRSFISLVTNRTVISERSAVALLLLATLHVSIRKSSTGIISTAIHFLKESKLVAKVVLHAFTQLLNRPNYRTYIRPSDFAPRVVQFGDYFQSGENPVEHGRLFRQHATNLAHRHPTTARNEQEG